MKILGILAVMLTAATPAAGREKQILFVGNSFTYGEYSPVQTYRPERVTDLNDEGNGGVPALFATFARQAGLDYRVSTETPGRNLDYHLSSRRAVFARRWDTVVLQGASLLDNAKPGDPALLIRSAGQIAALARAANPAADIRLVATWARADQIYRAAGHWSDCRLEDMTDDVPDANTQAASANGGTGAVVSVGDAWLRAIPPALARALQEVAYDTLAAQPRRPAYGAWGLEPGAADPMVRPGDDFYRSAQGRAVAALAIPDDRPREGWFSILEDLSRQRQDAILAEAAAAPAPDALGRFYAALVDERGIEARGTAPLDADLRVVRAASERRVIAALMGAAGRGFAGSLFDLRIRADARAPDRYAVQLLQGGLSLPDRDYYLDPRYAGDVRAFRDYVAAMLRLAGWPGPDAAADAVTAFETAVAKASWSRADSLDPVAVYHPMTVAELAAAAPGFAWPAFLDAAGLGGTDRIVVAQDSAVVRLARLFAATPLPTLRAWLAFTTADNAADVLPRRFGAARFGFRDRTLQGTPRQPRRWLRAVLLADRWMGDALNRVYVERHLPKSTQAAVAAMLANLERAASARIDRLERMGPDTRREAQAKIAGLLRKVGYPTVWRDYAGLRIDAGDAYGNLARARAADWEWRVGRLGGPVDRSEWQISPALVDATYNGSRNEVLLTAALMQPPLFDPAADAAVNYGAIGAVIGHELSHGFDTIGRRYDARGAVRDWWTAQDDARFRAEAAKLGAQYSRYEPLPGFRLNGALTMGENIADLGGAILALDAYHLSLGGRPAPVIDGMSGDQRFFQAFAQLWRSKQRDETARLRILLDSHAAEQFRVNGVVRNMDAWYDAFGVAPGDAMFLAPEDRVRIW